MRKIREAANPFLVIEQKELFVPSPGTPEVSRGEWRALLREVLRDLHTDL